MVFTSNYPTFRIISDTFCKFSREVFPDGDSANLFANGCKYYRVAVDIDSIHPAMAAVLLSSIYNRYQTVGRSINSLKHNMIQHCPL